MRKKTSKQTIKNKTEMLKKEEGALKDTIKSIILAIVIVCTNYYYFPRHDEVSAAMSWFAAGMSFTLMVITILEAVKKSLKNSRTIEIIVPFDKKKGGG